MRFAIPRDPASEARTIRQRIYRSDGPTHFDERPAGEWEFHDFHGHYHYTGFGVSRLWATDRSGGRAGVEPRPHGAQGQLLHRRHRDRCVG